MGNIALCRLMAYEVGVMLRETGNVAPVEYLKELHDPELIKVCKVWNLTCADILSNCSGCLMALHNGHVPFAHNLRS